MEAVKQVNLKKRTTMYCVVSRFKGPFLIIYISCLIEIATSFQSTDSVMWHHEIRIAPWIMCAGTPIAIKTWLGW